MRPSVVTPVTQKKPKSMMPTLSAAPMRRASSSGLLPPVWRRRAPAVEAAAMASRSARAVDTGTGAGAAAAEVLEVEAGMTPGPTGPAGAAPGAGAAGGGVVGGPRGTGGLGGVGPGA